MSLTNPEFRLNAGNRVFPVFNLFPQYVVSWEMPQDVHVYFITEICHICLEYHSPDSRTQCEVGSGL